MNQISQQALQRSNHSKEILIIFRRTVGNAYETSKNALDFLGSKTLTLGTKFCFSANKRLSRNQIPENYIWREK